MWLFKNRRFRGTQHRVRQLLVTANVVTSSSSSLGATALGKPWPP
jgi:hypothetical protein